MEGPGNSVPWQGVLGEQSSPNVPPTQARSAEKERAMFARSADELAELHGIEKKRKVQGTQFPGKGERAISEKFPETPSRRLFRHFCVGKASI